MKIKKTYHYIVEHERDVPWDVVLEVIRTTKGKRVGPNLIRYIRRSKKREIYVLCGLDREGNLRVINAKIRKKR